MGGAVKGYRLPSPPSASNLASVYELSPRVADVCQEVRVDAPAGHELLLVLHLLWFLDVVGTGLGRENEVLPALKRAPRVSGQRAGHHIRRARVTHA